MRVSEADLRAELSAAVGRYDCAAIRYDLTGDRSVALTGHVATAADRERLRGEVTALRGLGPVRFDVALMGRPHCEVARVLAPLLNHPDADAPSLRLGNAGSAVHLGDRLLVEVRAAAFDGYLYIDYFADDGSVLHLFPNRRDLLNIRPARNRFTLFKPPLKSCWAYSGSTGRQLVSLVALPKPLFAEPRPELETARDYLPALTDALAEALAAASRGIGAAALLFIDVQEAGAWPGTAAGCPAG